jgi:D-alanyl-lipoteichoic acid acyltransferase DltB (MBOAT superfamily)
MTDDFREVDSGVEDTLTFRRAYNRKKTIRMAVWGCITAFALTTLAIQVARFWGWHEVLYISCTLLGAIGIVQLLRNMESRL